jgi:toxin-antitoxin system PIN domain toxin
MIAVDTNLLVYAHRAGAPEHAAARRAIERVASGGERWGFCLPSVGEFWAQVTHPRCPGGPSTPAQASGFLRSLLDEGGAAVFAPGEGFAERLCRWAAELGVSGPRVSDLQIGLAALDGGAAELWTHDRGFIALPGLRLHDPLR